MELTGLGITGVAAITVICYLVGIFCKQSVHVADKNIPVCMGVAGLILGVVGMFVMPDFPGKDLITAMAIGIVSGLAATGINQIGKQIYKADEEGTFEADDTNAEG
jgi:O-antigen/teichoic acid export membrane protein